jgi:DNA-binding NarL/FixJ family response regulator
VACALFFCRATSTQKKYGMETGTTQEKMTVAFINDKTPIIDAICNDLNASGIEILFRSENIENAFSQLLALNELPRVCIIDLDFYDRNVLAQLQELKTRYPTIKLIAHSDIDADKTVKSLLEIGFEGYLLIGSDADNFKNAIGEDYNGKKYVSNRVIF